MSKKTEKFSAEGPPSPAQAPTIKRSSKGFEPYSETPKQRTASGEHSLAKFDKQVASFDAAVEILEATDKALGVAVSDVPTPMPPTRASDYTIIIRGRGPHHNANTSDANRIASTLVENLRRAGHEIVEATFSNGTAEPIEGEKS